MNVLLCMLLFLAMGFLRADSIIDGGGNKLTLTETGTLTIPSATKVTLKNLTLTGLKGERLVMINGTSKLVLDNTKIVLDGDYTFSQGSIEIINNSSIEGAYSFTCKSHNVLIAKASELKIGNNTTFVCTPTGGIRMPIRFEDDESTLFLDNATFKNYGRSFFDNPVGLIFTNGNFKIDGTSVLDSTGTTTDVALVLGTGSSGDGDCRLQIRPHAKLIVKNAGLVYRNNSANSFNTSGNLGTVELRDGGRFVVENASTPVGSVGVNVSSPWNVIGGHSLSLDNNSIDLDFDQLLGVSGVGGITAFSSSDLLGTGTDAQGTPNEFAYSADGEFFVASLGANLINGEVEVYTTSTWMAILGFDAAGVASTSATESKFSPDGRYLATTFSEASSGEVRVSVFNPFASSPIDNTGFTSISLAKGASTCDWSPDGRFIVVGLAGGTGTEVRVYQFDPTQSTPLTEIIPGAEYVTDTVVARFTPDGRYIVVGSGNAGSFELRAYRFDPTSVTPLSEITSGVDISSSNIEDIDISPDGHFVATAEQGGSFRVFRFDPASGLDPFGLSASGIGVTDRGTNAFAVEFSPDGLTMVIGIDGLIELLSFNSTTGVFTSLGSVSSGNNHRAIAYSPDGRRVVEGIEAVTHPNIKVFEPTRSNPVGKLQVSGGTMNFNQDMKLSNIKLELS